MNSNAVISCCWTLGSTTEDPFLLSLLFLIKSKEVKVFPTKIRHFTTRTFPEILHAVGSVTLQILSPKLLALLRANSLLHGCGNKTEKKKALTLGALPPKSIIYLQD